MMLVVGELYINHYRINNIIEQFQIELKYINQSYFVFTFLV